MGETSWFFIGDKEIDPTWAKNQGSLSCNKEAYKTIFTNCTNEITGQKLTGLYLLRDRGAAGWISLSDSR